MHNTSVDIFSRYLNVNDKTRNIYENIYFSLYCMKNVDLSFYTCIVNYIFVKI